MGTVHAYVWHRTDGTIIAVGRAVEGLQETITPMAGRETAVIEVEVEVEHLRDVHASHSVDIPTGKLIPKVASREKD